MNAGSLWKYALIGFIGFVPVNEICAADAPAKPDRTVAREEWQKMSPEERQARSKESRDKLREKFEKIPPGQREDMRKLLRGRIEKRVEDLRKKKADGSISDRELRTLDQWEQRLRRWDQRSKPDQPTDKADERPREKK